MAGVYRRRFPRLVASSFIASVLVAETSLLQVFVIDGRQMIKVFRRLWAQPRDPTVLLTPSAPAPDIPPPQNPL